MLPANWKACVPVERPSPKSLYGVPLKIAGRKVDQAWLSSLLSTVRLSDRREVARARIQGSGLDRTGVLANLDGEVDQRRYHGEAPDQLPDRSEF